MLGLAILILTLFSVIVIRLSKALGLARGLGKTL
jgi:hypothetical protein